MPKVKVTVGSEVKLCLNSCCSYTTKANLIKLHRKIKHNKKVCHTHDLGSYIQGQGHNKVKGHLRSRLQSGQRSKSYLNNNSKTTEANLTKLQTKIEYNVKVCCAQELGSYAQGQGKNQVRGQIAPKTRSG